MERLVKDAEGLDSSFKATRDENGDLAMSFADIVDAIHIVQTEMGITGTTAKEASSTISGSISSAKAAWQNLLVGLSDSEADLDSLIDDFFDSVVTVGENLMPKVERVLGSLAKIIPKALNKLFPIIKKVLQANLPTLIEGGTQLLVSLINGIVDALPILVAMLPQVIETIVNTLRERWPEIQAAGMELLTMLWDGIVSAWEWFSGVVSEQFGLVKDNLTQTWEEMKNDASEKWQNLVTSVTQKIDTLKTNIKTKFDNIKTTIKNIIDKIKGLFDFEWSLPKIKVPHIKFNSLGTPPYGIAGLGEPPDIDVVWNKKAYDTPYMFTKPTLMGFGDGVGGEMVYGHENLMRDIRAAVGDGNVTINVYPSQGMDEEKLARKIEKIFVDRSKQRRLLNA